MLKRTFKIPVKLVSINSLYYGQKKFGWTKEGRDMAFAVYSALSTPEHQQSLKDLRDAYQLGTHGFGVKIVSFIPRSIFFNQKGHISSRVCDLSNVEKGIVDLLFLEKHAKYADNLKTDDRFITRLISEKQPTNETEHFVEIEIELLPIER